MSKDTKKQVFEMSIGILIHNLLLFIVCLIFARTPSVFAGILAGTAGAVLLLISMALSTEACVKAQDEDAARKKMASHASLRSIVIFVSVILIWKFTRINPVTAIIGLLGLKTGAYLYPHIHKILNHKAGEQETPASMG